jgi:hypothetical protein
MKKGVFLLLSIVNLFSYELAVNMSDAKKLRECGIECQPRGSVCVFAKSFDKAQLERIKYYIKSEYGIESFYVKSVPKKVKKVLNNGLNTTEKTVSVHKEPKKAGVNNVSVKKTVYSYQVFTADNLQAALRAYEKVKHLPYARIEKIGKYYVVRVGAYNSYKEAKKAGLNYFLMKCYYIPERIVKGS